MSVREIVERLHMLRVSMEAQAGVSVSDLHAPASLVLFDLMNALEFPSDMQIHVLGAENALRLKLEYGIEWEEV